MKEHADKKDDEKYLLVYMLAAERELAKRTRDFLSKLPKELLSDFIYIVKLKDKLLDLEIEAVETITGYSPRHETHDSCRVACGSSQ